MTATDPQPQLKSLQRERHQLRWLPVRLNCHCRPYVAHAQAGAVRDEHVLDLNATRAVIRAGYSSRSAYKIGPELASKCTTRCEYLNCLRGTQACSIAARLSAMRSSFGGRRLRCCSAADRPSEASVERPPPPALESRPSQRLSLAAERNEADAVLGPVARDPGVFERHNRADYPEDAACGASERLVQRHQAVGQAQRRIAVGEDTTRVVATVSSETVNLFQTVSPGFMSKVQIQSVLGNIS